MSTGTAVMLGTTTEGAHPPLLVDADGKLIVSGGSGGGIGLNVQDYGAVPNGTTDSTEAFQAMMDASAAGGGLLMNVPGGAAAYKITQPLLMHGTTPGRLIGENQGLSSGAWLHGGDYIGPLIHIAADSVDPMPLVTSLVTGPGFGYKLTASGPGSFDNATWVDYSDAGTRLDLNGRAAFSVEFFFKADDLTTDFRRYMFGSFGSVTEAGAGTSAFFVRTDDAHHLCAYMNIGGSTTEIISSGTLLTATVYQCELSFDGATVRLFYGVPGGTSVLAGSVSVAGTITQGKWESIGPGQRFPFPHGPQYQGPLIGTLDSIRFSNIARHTAVYAVPSSKYTLDANTLLLQNFDNTTDDFSIVQTTSSVPCYLPIRGDGASLQRFAEVANLELQPDGFGGCGLFLNRTIDAYYHDLTIRSGRYGIDVNNDTFLCRFERLTFIGEDSFNRGALMLAAQAGIVTITDVDLTGWPLGILMRTGGGVISNAYNSGAATVIPIQLRDSTVTLMVAVSTEDANSSNWITGLYSSGSNVTIMGGGFESLVNTNAAIKSDTDRSLTIVGTKFTMNAGASKVIDVINAPEQAITLVDAYKDQAGVPWATSGWVSANPQIQPAPAIASGSGTSPSIAAGANYQAFRLTIGSGGSATSGVITMPFPALHGWNVFVNNLTAAAGHQAYNTVQTASSTTTVTLENQTKSSGAAVAWAAADVLSISAYPY